MTLIHINQIFNDCIYEVTMPMVVYEAQRPEMMAWLVDNFGYDEDSGRWALCEWEALGKAYFSFRFETDAMAFKLAWS